MGSRARATAEVNQIMRVLYAILDKISHLSLSFLLSSLSFWVLPDAFLCVFSSGVVVSL